MTDNSAESTKTNSFYFTPKSLCDADIKAKLPNNYIRFSIPLYQRLFTWGEEEIKQLLTDLNQACKQNPQTDYYLGMLTIKYNEETQSYDVIDGQQRLTVLILLATLLNKDDDSDDSKWNNFLSVNNDCRLYLPSREKDNQFFKEKILKKDVENCFGYTPALDYALEVMKSFKCGDRANNEENKIPLVKCQCFSYFVFKHLRFFVTVLPKSYNPRRLNQYFDRMNDSGKNLAPHEILLGEYLKALDSSKYDKTLITKLWKNASDLNKPMISIDIKSKKKKDSDKQEEILPLDEVNKILQDISGISEKKSETPGSKNDAEDTTVLTILDLAKSPKSINNRETIVTGYSQSLIPLNELLLLCLDRTLLCKQPEKNHRDSVFFNTGNIIETFKKYLSWSNPEQCEIIKFMETFFKSRLLLDLFFIRRDLKGEYLKPLAFQNSNDDEGELLMRYEEFLYSVESSSTNYRWFNQLLYKFEEIYNNNKLVIPCISDFNNHLKKIIEARDKEERENTDKLDLKSLSYSDNLHRYWFWRLDLALWLNRKKYFRNDDELFVANNYHFRRNRSIEHVAPQNPKSESKCIISEIDVLHDFGNLCMISSGLNSSLKNESFEIKKAHVESHLNETVGGTIESLKLLAIYCYYNAHNQKWDKEAIENHGKKMLDILNNAICPQKT